jgi:hypothetical protein
MTKRTILNIEFSQDNTRITITYRESYKSVEPDNPHCHVFEKLRFFKECYGVKDDKIQLFATLEGVQDENCLILERPIFEEDKWVQI